MTTASESAISIAEQEALKASIFQRLHPRVYLERFLSENIRPDGREFDAWRDASVNVGKLSKNPARIPIDIDLACRLHIHS